MSKSKIAIHVAGHLLFWLLNYCFIAFGSNFNWNGFSVRSGSLAYAYAYGILFNAALFYAQVFWLFPKIYIHNRKLKFYVLSVSVIIAISLIETSFDFILLRRYNINDKPLIGGLIYNIIFHILYSIAGFYYILKFEYIKSEKIRQTLLEETYKTELKYLKAQLNPHFLFNGINSVYHLIGKNDELAKETLLQFSGLLRYQLYESGTSISLEKELGYVSQYINIEDTRRGSDIQLQHEIEFENSTKKIAPLLLIPFIENAFKHCSHHIDDSKNLINIKIIEVEHKLTLSITNSFDNLKASNIIGGIGLNNVKRRLSLLYPDKHKLDVRKEKNNFIVDLTINL